MTTEIYTLVILSLFLLVGFLPNSAAKRSTYGVGYLLSNRTRTDLPPLPEWGQRADRAYENFKTYFPAYIVAILLLAHFQISDVGTQTAAIIYTVARFAHFIVYTVGWRIPRPITWITSILANIYLLVRVLSSI